MLAQSLAKLWPHRVHESNWLKNLFCRMHLHRWARLELRELAPGRKIRFCRWCSKIDIEGAFFGE